MGEDSTTGFLQLRHVPAPCNSEFLPKIGSIFWAKMFLRMSVKEVAVPLARSWTQILHDYPGIQGSSWGQVISCIDWWSGMWSGPGLAVTESKTRLKPQCLGQLYSSVGEDDTSRGICAALMVFLPAYPALIKATCICVCNRCFNSFLFPISPDIVLNSWYSHSQCVVSYLNDEKFELSVHHQWVVSVSSSPLGP